MTADLKRHPHLESVYLFVCRYIQTNGLPPSVREVAAGCYMSTSVVVRLLDLLMAYGYISREYGKARGIRLIRPCEPSS